MGDHIKDLFLDACVDFESAGYKVTLSGYIQSGVVSSNEKNNAPRGALSQSIFKAIGYLKPVLVINKNQLLHNYLKFASQFYYQRHLLLE